MGSNPVKQLDRVLSAQILGMFLLGKFTGDYAAMKFTATLGTETGYVAGILFSLAFVLFYPSIERTYKRWQKSLWGSRSRSEEQAPDQNSD